ncbi:caspase family protein [Bacillus marinisedimentorum]|uniref:caspase family protein n=1 Tax=Bacillus marinisedimentorum TaxID=1821260 RepID=UPI0008722A06|nr:caspase family protein [Bacillus marinisedimentorum]
MIALLSIGVEQCKIESLGKIPCASTDAKLVYTTLRDVLADEFLDVHSICLYSPTLSEFDNTLSVLRKTLTGEDKLVIYFSGHGELIQNENLDLIFSDAESSERTGRLTISGLKDKLLGAKFQSILLLDSCHSGAGLTIANSSNIFSNDQISIITSTNPFQRAKFEKDGSLFTQSLCKVINYLNELNKTISLNSIAEEIKALGESCYINVQNGISDVVLKANDIVLVEDSDDFQKRFLIRINESDITTREMYWYYLMDIPEKTKLEVVDNYLSDSYPSEPHWLVRRALGSLISDLKIYNRKERIILSLLESQNWMYQCIGLIGARKEIDNQSIRERVYNIFEKDTQIDAVWLANLYTTDSKYSNIDYALTSSLTKTSWGILDIWIRYTNKLDLPHLLTRIEKTVKDKSLLQPLYLHLFLKGIISETDMGKEFVPLEVKSSKFISFMYDLETRGKTKSVRLKWLLSSLYGNWRDQIDLKLNEYISNNNVQEINSELKIAAYLPLVEMRMAIFQYMAIYKDIFERHYESLIWGLRDPHPWVKRTAIKAFVFYPELLKEAFTENIDGKLYPGKLDFILEAVSLGIDCKDFIKKQDLTINEQKSIDWAIENTLKHNKIMI